MITDNLTNTVYFSSLLPEKCPVLNAHLVDAGGVDQNHRVDAENPDMRF